MLNIPQLIKEARQSLHELTVNYYSERKTVLRVIHTLKKLSGSNNHNVEHRGNHITAAGRKALSKRMKQVWAEKRQAKAQNRKKLHWTQKKENKARVLAQMRKASRARRKVARASRKAAARSQ